MPKEIARRLPGGGITDLRRGEHDQAAGGRGRKRVLNPEPESRRPPASGQTPFLSAELKTQRGSCITHSPAWKATHYALEAPAMEVLCIPYGVALYPWSATRSGSFHERDLGKRSSRTRSWRRSFRNLQSSASTKDRGRKSACRRWWTAGEAFTWTFYVVVGHSKRVIIVEGDFLHLQATFSFRGRECWQHSCGTHCRNGTGNIRILRSLVPGRMENLKRHAQTNYINSSHTKLYCVIFQCSRKNIRSIIFRS